MLLNPSFFFYLIPTVSFYLWSHSQRFSSPAWITMSCLPIGLSTTLGQGRIPWTETRLRFQMPSFQPSSALKGILCFSQCYAMRQWVFPLGHELSLKATLWRETQGFSWTFITVRLILLNFLSVCRFFFSGWTEMRLAAAVAARPVLTPFFFLFFFWSFKIPTMLRNVEGRLLMLHWVWLWKTGQCNW